MTPPGPLHDQWAANVRSNIATATPRSFNLAPAGVRIDVYNLMNDGIVVFTGDQEDCEQVLKVINFELSSPDSTTLTPMNPLGQSSPDGDPQYYTIPFARSQVQEERTPDFFRILADTCEKLVKNTLDQQTFQKRVETADAALEKERNLRNRENARERHNHFTKDSGVNSQFGIVVDALEAMGISLTPDQKDHLLDTMAVSQPGYRYNHYR